MQNCINKNNEVNQEINGYFNTTSGGLVCASTDTTSCTFTVGNLNNVVVFLHNWSGKDYISATISASTAPYASVGRGAVTLTTELGSSSFGVIANLEPAWFKTTSNTFTLTFTTTLEVVAIELSSTRQR